MAEAILKFNLPDDDDAFKLAQRGSNYYCAILEVKRLLRDFKKYDNSNPKKYPDYFESIQRAVDDVQTDDIS